MGCIKCGRDTVSEQVFCPECLEEMKNYPVRPGTIVQLPIRKGTSVAKKQSAKKRTLSLEEQVRVLKKRCRSLFILLILSILLSLGLLLCYAKHVEATHHKIGQNYTAITPTEAN